MMTGVFSAVLTMSLAGGALTLAVVMLTPLTRRVFSAGWHRRVHGVLAALYLLPAGPLLAALWRLRPTGAAEAGVFPADLPAPLENLRFPRAAQVAAAPLSGLLEAVLPLLPILWLGGALVLAVWRLAMLQRVRADLNRTSTPVTDPVLLAALDRAAKRSGCRRDIRLLESPCAWSPMLAVLGPAGRSAIILPAIRWEAEEAELVLRHELTHCRHRDLWLKWAGLLLCTVHWFNPLAWLLVRRLDRWTERACDEAVVRDMDAAGRRDYGRTILGVLARTQGYGAGVHAALCEDKRDMKERLGAMLKGKVFSRRVQRISMAVLALLCVSGLLAGAAAADFVEIPAAGGGIEEAAGAADDAPAVVSQAGGSYVTRNPGGGGEEKSNATKSVSGEAAGGDTGQPDTSEVSGTAPTQFLWPVDSTSHATTYRGHAGNGVDFAPGGSGHPVLASAAGVVVKTETGYVGYGYQIVLDHGGGFQTRYAHLGSIDVEVGDTVVAGQEIATIGRTGRASGNHLHFEVIRNGEAMHPMDFINAENSPMVFPEHAPEQPGEQ